MNAPRRPTLPQWKIELVREAMKVIEGEKGCPVTATMSKANPFILDV